VLEALTRNLEQVNGWLERRGQGNGAVGTQVRECFGSPWVEPEALGQVVARVTGQTQELAQRLDQVSAGVQRLQRLRAAGQALDTPDVAGAPTRSVSRLWIEVSHLLQMRGNYTGITRTVVSLRWAAAWRRWSTT
jgi:hypothetical protein